MLRNSNMNKQNICIIGGAGFIGSNLLRELSRKFLDSNIKIFDNFSSGKIQFIPTEVRNKIEIIKSDIKNIEILTAALQGVDIVFHLAANPDISRAASDPSIDFWEGTYLTNNVLEAMRLSGVKKLFYTSGSGVYGDVPNELFNESYGPCLPISTYGASKLASEALICSYCHMFEFKANVFRFANVVGPNQTHGVGYDFINKLLENNSRLEILGDGSQDKSYVHVSDIIDAMLMISEQQLSKNYNVFNVTSSDTVTVNEIANIVIKALNLTSQEIQIIRGSSSRGWKGDVPKIKFDSAKIKALGWAPKYNSSQAVQKSVEQMISSLGT
jgi:UDP-glucose 4-epimerase